MANMKFLNDHGQVIVHDGVPYRKLSGQPSIGVPNATTLPDDLFDVQAYTWTYDDSNVSGGSDHRIWTAEEMAVASLSQFDITGPSLSGGTHTIFTAPGAGVCRLWGWDGFTWYVNGQLLSGVASSQVDARALKVIQNDVISISSGLGYGSCLNRVKFIPFVWPISE